MTVLRSAAALLLKELQHHIGMAVLLGVLTAPALAIALVFTFGTGGASVTGAGLGLVYYWMPVVVLVVVRRLVVLEREDGTHSFLVSLPPPAWLRFGVKLAVGWMAVVLTGLAMLLVVVLAASFRELVTLGWTVQLMLQSALYLAAWTSVTFAVAHLGRYRHWVWLSLLAGLSMTPDNGWQVYVWHAAMADPWEYTRHHIPWAGLAVTTLYLVGFSAVGLFLATWRGGLVPDSLFREASTRDRVAGATVVLVWMMFAETWPEVGTPELRGWDTLPEVGSAQVRSPDPALRVHGFMLADALDRMTELGGMDPPTLVVLTRQPEGPEPWPEPVMIHRWDADTLVLRVAGPPTSDFVARSVEAVVTQRSQGLTEVAADRAWLRDGLGLYVGDAEGQVLAERRAAWAFAHGLDEEALADWDFVLRRFGDDIGAGVAALGLRALGDDVGPVVATSLLQRRAPGVLGSLGLRFSAPAIPDAEAHRMAWFAEIQKAYKRRGHAVAELPTLQAAVYLHTPDRADIEVGVRLEHPAPEGARLVARERAQVRRIVLPEAGRWSVPVEGQDAVLPTWAAPWGVVEATVEVWAPELEGRLISGWTEVRR